MKRLKYPDVTYSSMAQVISELKIEKEIEELCKRSSLNLDFLRRLFKGRTRGLNNTDLAQKLGVHRVTIQRYMETLRKLADPEFEMLYKYLLGKKSDTNN